MKKEIIRTISYILIPYFLVLLISQESKEVKPTQYFLSLQKNKTRKKWRIFKKILKETAKQVCGLNKKYNDKSNRSDATNGNNI